MPGPRPAARQAVGPTATEEGVIHLDDHGASEGLVQHLRSVGVPGSGLSCCLVCRPGSDRICGTKATWVSPTAGNGT